MKCHYSREVFWRAVAQSQNFRIYCCSSGPRKILIAFLAADIQMKAVTPSSETFTNFFLLFLGPNSFRSRLIFFLPNLLQPRFPFRTWDVNYDILGLPSVSFLSFQSPSFFSFVSIQMVAASLSKQCLAWTVSNCDLGTNSQVANRC